MEEWVHHQHAKAMDIGFFLSSELVFIDNRGVAVQTKKHKRIFYKKLD
jgi:hypothetical protein